MEHLTPRGWLVAGILIGLAVWGLWEVASHLLWTGSGWEWCEDLLNCEREGKR
jgi:hypothetical protein